MSILTPIEMNAAEKLELLQRLDRYRKWQSLDEQRYCLACRRIIQGHDVKVVGGTRGTGPIRLICATKGCHSIPMDWVIPTEEVLKRVSSEEDKHSSRARTPGCAREKFYERLRRFATRFRPAA
jgi:hypothetical protein